MQATEGCVVGVGHQGVPVLPQSNDGIEKGCVIVPGEQWHVRFIPCLRFQDFNSDLVVCGSSGVNLLLDLFDGFAEFICHYFQGPLTSRLLRVLLDVGVPEDLLATVLVEEVLQGRILDAIIDEDRQDRKEDEYF